MLARWTGGELLRLQCYEGIDVSQAVYEWDYARQLLHLRAAEARGASGSRRSRTSSTPSASSSAGHCCRRSPAAAAVRVRRPPVLLIDEVDRADDEFEAFLLEILSDYTVTVPELGTFRAERPPVVVITSNRTRDVHDALKRRCLYHWVEHPDFEREVAHRRAARARASTASSPARLRAPSPGCGRWASTSPPAWPRRSTGPRRSRPRVGQARRDGRRPHARQRPQVPGGRRAGTARRHRRARARRPRPRPLTWRDPRPPGRRTA